MEHLRDAADQPVLARNETATLSLSHPCAVYALTRMAQARSEHLPRLFARPSSTYLYEFLRIRMSTRKLGIMEMQSKTTIHYVFLSWVLKHETTRSTRRMVRVAEGGLEMALSTSTVSTVSTVREQPYRTPLIIHMCN